jgi:anti-sigma regulatory factor (Ser/Thr protein kinase)
MNFPSTYWVYPLAAVLGYLCYRLGCWVQKGRTERAEYRELLAVYREILPKITHGRVRLISPAEYRAAYAGDDPLLIIDVEQKDDIPRVRQTVDEFFADFIPHWKEVRSPILTALSEAVTNVVKHTPGGRVLVYLESTGPRFHVEDCGSGMDLAKLPAMVFVSGYSETSSLGAGLPLCSVIPSRWKSARQQRGQLWCCAPIWPPY